MSGKLTGHTTWAAQAKERREAEFKELYETYKLRPDDIVRFPRAPGTTKKVEGKPINVNSDGSITCSAGGKARAIRPEKIEVKMIGPRGGRIWAPLIPPTEK